MTTKTQIEAVLEWAGGAVTYPGLLGRLEHPRGVVLVLEQMRREGHVELLQSGRDRAPWFESRCYCGEPGCPDEPVGPMIVVSASGVGAGEEER